MERENILIKRLGLTTLIVAGLIITLGQTIPQQPDAIRATMFVLIDENGQQRATLGVENGRPALVLEDTSGRGVIQLQVTILVGVIIFTAGRRNFFHLACSCSICGPLIIPRSPTNVPATVLLELEGIDVRVVHFEPHANRLPSEARQFTTAPHNGLLDRISLQRLAVA